jgi:hypothetical protein
MTQILNNPIYDFISTGNKEFICSFDGEMTRLGYDFDNKIGSGFCWGKYMMLYRKTGVKNEKVYTRIYIRESSIVLRMFFNQIDKHRDFIEKAAEHIKEVFTGSHGDCQHCKNEHDGICKFRKTYTIDNRIIEKCNDIVFEFHDPITDKLSDYLALFTEFYPAKI